MGKEREVKYYEIDADVNSFKSYRFLSDDDYQYTRKLVNRGEYINDWKVIRIEVDPNIHCNEIGDFPGLLEFPLVSSSFKHFLEKRSLQSECQFLEVIDNQTDISFFLLNVIAIVDILDREKTIFKYFEGDLLGIKVPCFKSISLDKEIFKAILDGSRLIKKSIFINEQLKDDIEANRLQGIRFLEIPQE